MVDTGYLFEILLLSMHFRMLRYFKRNKEKKSTLQLKLRDTGVRDG